MSFDISSGQFQKLLEARLDVVVDEAKKKKELEDITPQLYTVKTSDRAFEEYFEISSVPDIVPFDGRLTNLGRYPGWTHKIEPGEFGAMMTTERKLLMNQDTITPESNAKALIDSAYRVRHKKAIRPFTHATSVAFDFMYSEEGVALASSAHSTKVPNISTSTGFSNAGVSAFNPVSLAATRINMRRFRNSIGERFQLGRNLAIVHPDTLTDRVMEITKTSKGLDDAHGNYNPLQDHGYKSIPIFLWDEYSTQNWALVDLDLMKQCLIWINKLKVEYKKQIDFMTYGLMQAVYDYYGYGWSDWRWMYYNTVG